MKKAIIVLMVTLLLMSSFTATAYAQSPSDNSAQIDALLDKRAELICLEKWDDIDLIDQQLERLGVEKLTAEEVEERFVNAGASVPYVLKPVSGNVTWLLARREELTYGGVTYDIQTLTAQPNDKASNLKVTGSRAISSSYKWSAGAMNALSVIGSSLLGNIPGASFAMTVYDTVSGFISGISKSTEISSAEIVYSYSHTTTVSFKYVKVKGQSDNSQSLAFISTKGMTAVGYQYPTFIYSGGSATPHVIQDNRTITSIPSEYNSSLSAVKAYTDIYAARNAYVRSVTITGLESKSVSTIYPLCPEIPAHVY